MDQLLADFGPLPGGGGGAVPAKPRVTAETAANFSNDVSVLKNDTNYLGLLWTKYNEKKAVEDNVLGIIGGALFADNVPLQRIDLQSNMVLYRRAKRETELALVDIQLAQHEVLVNNAPTTCNMAIDILAHRSPAQAMPTPGAPLRVLVDNATLGPPISDADLLLRSAGLTLSTL